MKILLDTHVVLWAIADPARLSPRARILLVDDEHELLFIAASSWEIQLKRRAGKLTLPNDPSFLPGHLRRLGVRETIAVAPEHTYRVATLPLTHRDPFDCLLVAQCLSEGLALMSVDPAFASLGVSPLW